MPDNTFELLFNPISKNRFKSMSMSMTLSIPLLKSLPESRPTTMFKLEILSEYSFIPKIKVGVAGCALAFGVKPALYPDYISHAPLTCPGHHYSIMWIWQALRHVMSTV